MIADRCGRPHIENSVHFRVPDEPLNSSAKIFLMNPAHALPAAAHLSPKTEARQTEEHLENGPLLPPKNN